MSVDLLTHEAPSNRLGGIWDYISPSRLSLWSRCPLAWKCRYMDGVPTAATPSLFVGKATHALLEAFYRHRQLGITLTTEDVCGRLRALWGEAIAADGSPFASADDEAKAKGQTENLVRAYLAQVPADEARPLAVEAAISQPLIDPTTGEDLGMPLLGILDLVLDAAEGPVVVDFKTAAKSTEPCEVVHELQLSSYAYLWRQAAGAEESELQIRSLVKTKMPKIVVHRYPARTDVHFRRLFALIREYLDALDRGRFSYRPGWTCASCDFATLCCRWAG